VLKGLLGPDAERVFGRNVTPAIPATARVIEATPDSK
jgi:hypothetical protein